MDIIENLHTLGWPEGVQSGTLRWRSGDRDQNHMNASISVSANGEITMSSQVQWGEQTHPRFNAIIPAGHTLARVSMPGYERQDVPMSHVIALFRAHTAGLQIDPVCNVSKTRMAP